MPPNELEARRPSSENAAANTPELVEEMTETWAPVGPPITEAEVEREPRAVAAKSAGAEGSPNGVAEQPTEGDGAQAKDETAEGLAIEERVELARPAGIETGVGDDRTARLSAAFVVEGEAEQDEPAELTSNDAEEPGLHDAAEETRNTGDAGPTGEAARAEREPIAPRPGAANAAAPGGNMGREAIESDRESDATSTEATIEIRPGKPAAGQGLDIRTKRPEFSKFTRLTAAPRNPELRLKFDRRGKVVSAVFLVRSGYKDVDEPVLNAVYLWTAKGEALARLPDDPTAGLSIRVRIVLR
ncbi:MAG: hypothetical protein H7Y88_09770 [Phycisphaerales bacterium]|nr:hypothetical protein [Phycisphaerales bacterium]